MQWAIVPDNPVLEDRIGAIAMSSLLCRVVVDDHNSLNSFQVVISSSQHCDRIATVYNAWTEGFKGRYWTKSSFPVTVSTLLQTEPLILGQQGGDKVEGLVSVGKDHSSDGSLRCIGQRCAPNGGYSSSFQYQTGQLGHIRSVFSHLNIFRFEHPPRGEYKMLTNLLQVHRRVRCRRARYRLLLLARRGSYERSADFEHSELQTSRRIRSRRSIRGLGVKVRHFRGIR